jgi:hypothetical protein
LLKPLAIICLMLCGFQQAPYEADIAFFPPVLEVVRDSTGYVQYMLPFTSNTGDSVQVTHVEGSCRCATASVQRPWAYDTVPGKLFLNINAKHLVDSVTYVDYTIRHTGPNSPSTYRVIVRLPRQP